MSHHTRNTIFSACHGKMNQFRAPGGQNEMLAKAEDAAEDVSFHFDQSSILKMMPYFSSSAKREPTCRTSLVFALSPHSWKMESVCTSNGTIRSNSCKSPGRADGSSPRCSSSTTSSDNSSQCS
ncbi:hypothetical protein B9Z55_024371 [Caenorhabditis nigoni]|uniref:Uncharacterized protein n=1 Tax=Caenorhabditis nigoni TaxID=1611254 RepID=A0A2G5STP0_9PELO|nr:hypothetical protein B9Z55_024371 [Caenorhabditis nigoni]